jgi:hypothetical protein
LVPAVPVFASRFELHGNLQWGRRFAERLQIPGISFFDRKQGLDSHNYLYLRDIYFCVRHF